MLKNRYILLSQVQIYHHCYMQELLDTENGIVYLVSRTISGDGKNVLTSPVPLLDETGKPVRMDRALRKRVVEFVKWNQEFEACNVLSPYYSLRDKLWHDDRENPLTKAINQWHDERMRGW